MTVVMPAVTSAATLSTIISCRLPSARVVLEHKKHPRLRRCLMPADPIYKTAYTTSGGAERGEAPASPETPGGAR